MIQRILVWFLVAVQSMGATFYVSTTGNDANDGSAGSPKLTIQAGLNLAFAGDTVVVLAGDYAAGATTARAGSSGSYISLVGSNSPSFYGLTIDHDYVELRDFRINGTGRAHAILVDSGADYARIVGNVFTNCPDRHLTFYWDPPQPTYGWVERNQFLGATNVALGLHGLEHTVTNNYFIQDPDGPSRGAGDAIICMASNTRVVGNTFTNWSRPSGSTAHIDIIQAFTSGCTGDCLSTNVIFENNLVVDCRDTQMGMIEDQEGAGALRGWIFRNNVYDRVSGLINIYAPSFQWYNNTFIQSGYNSGSPLLFRVGELKGSGTNGVAYNNIFYLCGSNPTNSLGGFYGFDPATNSLTFTADHNLVVGTGAGTVKDDYATEGREANGINGSDPLFVNLAGGDYRLQSVSPARGAGTNLTSLGFSTDIAGTARGTSWDMGAYQSSSGTTARVINATRAVIQTLTQ